MIPSLLMDNIVLEYVLVRYSTDILFFVVFNNNYFFSSCTTTILLTNYSSIWLTVME